MAPLFICVGPAALMVVLWLLEQYMGSAACGHSTQGGRHDCVTTFTEAGLGATLMPCGDVVSAGARALLNKQHNIGLCPLVCACVLVCAAWCSVFQSMCRCV